MPPALRRTYSSPAVRSAPYPSSSSLARAASAAHPRRSSSGSETTTRRVLADIDWWRVTDGQCAPAPADAQPQQPEETDDEQDEHETVQVQVQAQEEQEEQRVQPPRAPSPAFVLAAGLALERPTTPPTPQLTFRIPSTRVRLLPGRRYASESSISSLESSPDLPLTPRESLSFFDPGFPALVVDPEDAHADVLPVTTAVYRAFSRVTDAGLDAEADKKKTPFGGLFEGLEDAMLGGFA